MIPWKLRAIIGVTESNLEAIRIIGCKVCKRKVVVFLLSIKTKNIFFYIVNQETQKITVANGILKDEQKECKQLEIFKVTSKRVAKMEIFSKRSITLKPLLRL